MVTSEELGRGQMRQAQARLRAAEIMLEEGAYAYVVRASQEVIELALKGALFVVGVDPPRWHDVGPVVQRERGRFAALSDAEVDFLVSVSAQLRDARERSMYGDEDAGLPPDALFSDDDARKALVDARRVYELIERATKRSDSPPAADEQRSKDTDAAGT